MNNKGRWFFGGLAASGATCFTHPLDLIKVHLQTQQGSGSMMKIGINIVKTQGPLALYNGISASLLRQLTYSTTRFGIYEVLKQSIMASSNDPITFRTLVLMAGVAGGVGGVVGTPSDKVNVRMQNDIKLPPDKRHNYKNAVDGLIRVYKEEGPKYMFSGLTAACSRAVVVNIGGLAFYDQVKTLLLGTKKFVDNTTTHFISSFAAAIVCTTLAQPLDVLKTRTMNANPGEYKNLWDIVVNTAKDGPLAFFKGYVPAFVRLAPQTILTFIFLEQLRFRYGIPPDH